MNAQHRHDVRASKHPTSFHIICWRFGVGCYLVQRPYGWGREFVYLFLIFLLLFFFIVHSVFERCPFSNKNGHEVCYRFLYSMTSTGEMWLIVILSAWTGLGSENSTRRLLLSASPQQHSHTHTQAFWSSRFSNQLLTRKCGTCSSDRSVLASVLTSSAAPELRLFSLDLASARLSLLNTRRSRVICVPTPGAFTCKTVLRARVLPELGALMIRVRDFR